jgi:two-component system, NarL family, sensor kinase
MEADSLKRAGVSEYLLGNYHTALKHYYDALSIYNDLGDSSKQALTLIAIGILNSGLDDHDNSLLYYEKALGLSSKKNELRTAQIRNNMGLEYLHKNNYQLALENLNRSVSIKQKLNLNPTEYNYANIGRVHLKLNNIDSAVHYLKLGMDALVTYGSSTSMRDSMEVFNYYGEVLIAKKDYLNAQDCFIKSLKIANKLANKGFIQSNSSYLSSIYKRQHNLDSALKYSELSKLYNDSLFNEKNLKTIAKLETQHTLNQIEKENLRELQRKNNVIYVILTMTVFLFLLAGVIRHSYLRSRRTTQLLHLKNEEISRQRIEKLLHQIEIKSIKSNIEGQEKERKRIAEELHDGIGGSLSGIKLALLNLNDQKKTEAAYNKVVTNIDQVCAEIRTISHNLIPPNFEQTGFVNVLQQYFYQFSSDTKIKLEYQLHPENELNSLLRTFHIELYRIVQEALNNIKKHAQATSLEIQLLMDQDDINLIIEDNGIGFDPDKITYGIGLNNISSRVNLLNGTIDIDSKVNRGTIINIDFNKTTVKDGK